MNTLRNGKNRLLLFACGICFLGAAAVVAQRPSGPQAPNARDVQQLSRIFRAVAEETTPSVVSIETRGKPIRVRGNLPFGNNDLFREFLKNDPRFRDFLEQQPEERELPAPQGRGSGFILDSTGIIVTNSHVVQGAEQVTVRLHDGREFSAKDIKADPRSDLAILRIDAPGNLKPLRLGNSNQMEVGDWVLAVGSPFGYDLSVTAGIISGKGRGPRINEREDYLQTDAAINPGNSGGPLLNMNGEVIGINTAISSRSGGYDGIGFAVPVNMAKWVIQQLIDKGEVTRAYLGVKMKPIDNVLSRTLGVPLGRGVIVVQVFPDSPAAKAGVQEGDIILELDNQVVHSTRGLQETVERLQIGKTYDMTVFRNGREKQLRFEGRALPEDFSLLGSRFPTQESKPSEPEEESFDDLGLEIKDLTPQIAKQLGYTDAEGEPVKGVLVTSVKVNSPAYEAGIRSGDVIEKMGNNLDPVTSVEQFRETIKKLSGEKGVLVFVRNRGGTDVLVIQTN